MTLWLEQIWSREGAPESKGGSFTFRLHNAGDSPVQPVALCYSSMTRINAGAPIEGAALDQRFGNHHRLLADPGHEIAPDGIWTIRIMALSHAPTNRSQGAMAAWLETADGILPIILCDLLPPPDLAGGKPPTPGQGNAPIPLGLLPWPQQVRIDEIGKATNLRPGEGMPAAAMIQVAALHRRLFPLDPSLLDLQAGRPVDARREVGMAASGYRLDFAPDRILLAHSDASGLRHGLIALAQMIHAARKEPRFALPRRGQITDAPRFGWRGLHVDVARNFRPIEDIRRILDIMAWHRLNCFHWHLTDDEGWRLEIPALPQLTQIGSRRGVGTPLASQYADGPAGQSGYYTTAEIRDMIDHAAALGIEITPEIDMPGHMTALLAALPHLADPDEVPDSYRSIQGYPNNALNPARSQVYEAVNTILDTVCDLFPSRIIHVGGDEVDPKAWRRSPAAMALAQTEGYERDQTTHRLQALFMRRVQAMLRSRDRITGGWDECVDGGGIDRRSALLFAWRSVEKTAEVLDLGYDVVATPGQVYYMDMVQDHGWNAIGTSWAGIATPQDTYAFEPSEGLPKGTEGRLVGVQACVWSEHLNTRERWNQMVFPRLSAVAEAAWTQPQHKDWNRFTALSRLMPRL